MLKNYLKVAFRDLIKHKSYSVINIVGLAIGMACAFLILLWVEGELSYDRFHKNANEIFRVVGDDAIVKKIAVTCGPLAESLKNDFPDVIKATRYTAYSGSSFKYKDKIFYEDQGAFVDPDFFEMFSFPLVKGDSKTVLSDLSNIVITERMAKRLFGNDEALGKVILIDGKEPIKVSGVIKDPPSNSQLQFNFVINTMILKYIGFSIDEWGNASFHTFIQVQKGINIQNLEKGIAEIMPRHIPGFARKLFLQPLMEIHLADSFMSDLSGLGDKKYVYLFSAIGVFLLLIACINYINLSTARALKREKEVGLRKLVGSSRFQLITQFFIESLITVIISSIIATVLVQLLLPLFIQLSGKNMMTEFLKVSVLIGLIPLILVSFILAGVYPAFYLSSLKPLAAMKKITGEGKRRTFFRKILVVLQFSISIILIVGTTVVYQQLSYIKNKKLGFDKENILFFKAKGKFIENYDIMKNELLKKSSIMDVTAEDKLLLNVTSSTDNLNWEDKNPQNYININYTFVDYNYFNMLKVEIIDGRNFSPQLQTDRTDFILNEEAVKQMNLKSPIGKQFLLNNNRGKIIGVIKNTNFKSLHQRIMPCAYMLLDGNSPLSFKYNGVILVKVYPGKTSEAIATIEGIWKAVNPDHPFEYHFLDETIEEQYQNEKHTGVILGCFSIIAIFISCLGLYAMASFIEENRTKEIGIRKVLGATTLTIMNMLGRDLTKWLLIANIIAWPVAWYFTDRWLQDYAYRIDINLWIFILSGGIALFIALVTVSVQTIKAAVANPVNSLRSE